MNQKFRGVTVGTSGLFAGFFTGEVLLQDWPLYSKVIAVMIVSVSVSLIVLKFTERYGKKTGCTS